MFIAIDKTSITLPTTPTNPRLNCKTCRQIDKLDTTFECLLSKVYKIYSPKPRTLKQAYTIRNAD